MVHSAFMVLFRPSGKLTKTGKIYFMQNSRHFDILLNKFGRTASITAFAKPICFTSLYWQYTTNGRDGAMNFSRPINTGQGWKRLAITNLKEINSSMKSLQINHWNTAYKIALINTKYDMTRLINITIHYLHEQSITWNHIQNVYLMDYHREIWNVYEF